MTSCWQGSKIQVKGIPDIARHTSVKVTDSDGMMIMMMMMMMMMMKVTACRDNDNYDYPRGLICAAERGEMEVL